MPDRLQGKVCIVTGAAQGIGAAYARRLASEGADVAIIDLSRIDQAGEVVSDIARSIRPGSAPPAGSEHQSCNERDAQHGERLRTRDLCEDVGKAGRRAVDHHVGRGGSGLPGGPGGGCGRQRSGVGHRAGSWFTGQNIQTRRRSACSRIGGRLDRSLPSPRRPIGAGRPYCTPSGAFLDRSPSLWP